MRGIRRTRLRLSAWLLSRSLDTRTHVAQPLAALAVTALTTPSPEIVSLVGGLVTGLVTGYIFERRSTKALAQQNKELRTEMGVLKATILSLGGEVDGEHELPVPDNLVSFVAARATATQDPTGRVNRAALVAHFLQQGYVVSDIEAAISSLCVGGTLKEDGSWLRIT
jgi:hypothetical protein